MIARLSGGSSGCTKDRRWNGWGSPSVALELPPAAGRLLHELLGPGQPPRDTALANVLACIPPSRLAAHPLVSADAAERLAHAHGQSLPDLVAMRSGRVGILPDGVAYPETEEAVRELLGFAARAGASLIPYGGGTSVAGHVTPLAGERPVLTLDLRRLMRLFDFDATSGLATFGAGITGPDLEAQLRARGCTLGHFPQSFEYSTLGGWIATRSSGQYSLGYGRIERLFAGGRIETPSGALDLPPVPASAAGMDLREMVLGSEGRLGIVTRATVRTSAVPEREQLDAFFFPAWDAGFRAVRELAQAQIPLLMLRLSTGAETQTTLALARQRWLTGALEYLLALRGAGPGKCLLLLGVAGRERIVDAARREARAIIRRHGGVPAVAPLGRQWKRQRFRTPYLRDALWARGYAVDTVETAAEWARVPALLEAVEDALRRGLEPEGERVHVITHLSHLYPSGSSIYSTYLFRVGAGPEETLRRWHTLKGAASRAVVGTRGTISHHHGVGLDHLPYLEAEKGPLGMGAMRAVCSQMDPGAMMNPGKLFV